MMKTEPRRSLLGAALRQRCPRCREGRIFRGQITMNRSCPVCGLPFEREEGYFLGAMYVSYPLSIPILGGLLLLGYLALPGWPIELLIALAGVAYIPFMPFVYRWARVIWIHFERWASPGTS